MNFKIIAAHESWGGWSAIHDLFFYKKNDWDKPVCHKIIDIDSTWPPIIWNGGGWDGGPPR
jgi:hypothetical protein